MTAGFLAAAREDESVRQIFAGDLRSKGYVANLTRVWAHLPEGRALVLDALDRAREAAGLDARSVALLVTSTAAAIEDSYCSLAFGTRLARAGGEELAVQALSGPRAVPDPRDRRLAGWARQVATDANATTAADVDELREAGFDDRQIFALTLFVALRLAFATVNDALGARPDAELVQRAPAGVRDAVDYGRPPAILGPSTHH